ncbi:MAG: hypothetical protein JWQ36_2329 [Enterovirga sp.]|jgi:hypothetical protein|nr:hypothetical protein [Enterovirga sp.]
MTQSLRKCIGAGALGAALLAGTLMPAQASEASAAGLGRAAAQAQTQAYPGESFSQYYRGGYGGRRYGGRGYRRGYGGGAAAAGIVGGLALGALAGAAIANSQPAPGYYGGPGQPVGNIYGADPNWVNYCASRYRSFDPRTGTFLANDGYRYPCQ